MPDVVEPDDLSVRGIEERRADSIEVIRTAGKSSGVALRLSQDVLGAQRDLLRLHNAGDITVEPERVVGGAVSRLLFFGAVRPSRWREARPSRSVESRIDARF